MTIQASDPRSGWFAFVHHTIPIEYSWDIDERLRVILEEKPPHERATRLRCLTYIPRERIPASLRQARWAYEEARRAHEEAWWAYEEAWRAYKEARREEWPDNGLSIALAHVPDAPWDHVRHTLVFSLVPE